MVHGRIKIRHCERSFQISIIIDVQNNQGRKKQQKHKNPKKLKNEIQISNTFLHILHNAQPKMIAFEDLSYFLNEIHPFDGKYVYAFKDLEKA